MIPILKKLAWSAGAGVVAFAGLKWGVSSLLGTTIAAAAGGLLVAYVVYTRVALWEIEGVINNFKK